MINVVREDYRITLDGHARFDTEEGKDIVCAASSILVYALADTLNEFRAKGVVKSTNISTAKGHAIISVEPTQYHKDVVKAVFDMAEKGFGILAYKYPENVCFASIEK